MKCQVLFSLKNNIKIQNAFNYNLKVKSVLNDDYLMCNTWKGPVWHILFSLNKAFVAFIYNYWIMQSVKANKEGPDQTAQMHRMIWALAIHIQKKNKKKKTHIM